MKLGLAIAAVVSSWSTLSSNAFVPLTVSQQQHNTILYAPDRRNGSPLLATVETTETLVEADVDIVGEDTPVNGVHAEPSAVALSASEIKERLESQLTKLREKDSKSPKLSKEVSRF